MYPMNHLCFRVHTSLYASVYAKEIQVASGISTVHHEEALHNYFKPRQRKYIALHNITSAVHDGNVRWNADEYAILSYILFGCIYYAIVYKQPHTSVITV